MTPKHITWQRKIQHPHLRPHSQGQQTGWGRSSGKVWSSLPNTTQGHKCEMERLPINDQWDRGATASQWEEKRNYETFTVQFLTRTLVSVCDLVVACCNMASHEVTKCPSMLYCWVLLNLTANLTCVYLPATKGMLCAGSPREMMVVPKGPSLLLEEHSLIYPKATTKLS